MTSGGQGEQNDLEPQPPPLPPPWILPPPPPTQPHLAAALSPHSEDKQIVCLNCGYSLRGLSPEGNCPECGTPVQRSLHGNLLAFSSGDYLTSLNRGLIWILIAVLLSVAVGCGALALMVMAASGSSMAGVQPLMQVVSIPISVLSLFGWWLFSTPDPAIVGDDTGDTPRKIVRIAVIILTCTTAMELVVQVVALDPQTSATVASGTKLLTGAASIAQFFASMLYVAWLAPRLPDPAMKATARQYMWVLPIIYVIGFCICFIGPIVASVMYFVMLNQLRVRIAAIRQWRAEQGNAFAY